MKRTTALIGAFALLATGCSAASSATTLTDEKVAFEPVADRDVDLEPMVSAAHSIGLTLAAGDGNVVTSPLSFALALAMLGEGATHEGEAEIAALLGPDRSQASSALISSLADYEADPEGFDADGDPPKTPLLHLANRAVVADGAGVNEDFLGRVRRFHDSEVVATDFSEAGAKKLLDEWVNHHTAGLIDESAIDLRPDTVLVLQNAALFAASWADPFKAKDTWKDSFTLADGTEISVDAMHGEQYVPSADADGWRAIRMLYTEGFSADFLLPPNGTDPAELSEETLRDIGAGLDEASPDSVQVIMPKLNLATSIDLMSELEALQLVSLEDPQAAPLENILPGAFLSQATQQATLRIDEEGTVASAVTEMAAEEAAAFEPPTEIRFDRPYLVVIHHDATGIPLFLAAVRDPSDAA